LVHVIFTIHVIPFIFVVFVVITIGVRNTIIVACGGVSVKEVCEVVCVVALTIVIIVVVVVIVLTIVIEGSIFLVVTPVIIKVSFSR
jgi:hypothetical protein